MSVYKDLNEYFFSRNNFRISGYAQSFNHFDPMDIGEEGVL